MAIDYEKLRNDIENDYLATAMLAYPEAAGFAGEARYASRSELEKLARELGYDLKDYETDGFDDEM